MFFHVKLERNITLEPRHFGSRMNAVLEEKLRNEVRAERDPVSYTHLTLPTIPTV